MISVLDGEWIIDQAGIPVQDWMKLYMQLETAVRELDKELSIWWAELTYAAL